MKKAICLITSLVLILGISSSIQAKEKFNVKRISGDNRYQTSINISNEFSSSNVENVIITSGDDFPDALAGSVLSKKLNAPILLTGKDTSSRSNSLDYIQKHLSTNGTVYILGGEGSVSSNYENSLKSLGYKNIKRLAGINRFDTNKSIVKSMNISKGTPIVLVNGYGFADALSVSSIAASKGYPILMGNSNSLPDETIQELKDIQPDKVYIIGGQGSLSNNINNQVKNIVSSIDDNNIIRISGISRYDTSLNVCKYFNISSNTAIISNGENFPDALSGSALAAKLNAPIILTNGTDISSQKSFIDNSNYTNLILLGGTSSISKLEEWILNGMITSDQAIELIKSKIPYSNEYNYILKSSNDDMYVTSEETKRDCYIFDEEDNTCDHSLSDSNICVNKYTGQIFRFYPGGRILEY